MTIPIYDPAAGPAEFEHRGDECDVHGANVPHFRIKGGGGRFYCVACAQDIAAQQASAPVSAVRPKLGVVNGHALDGNGGAKEALDALEPERAAVEHVAVGLQRDLAVATAECARLRADIDRAITERAKSETHLQQQLDAAQKQAAWALQEQAKAVAALEDRRVDRWHATACARIAAGGTVEAARAFANEMHGPLSSAETAR